MKQHVPCQVRSFQQNLPGAAYVRAIFVLFVTVCWFSMYFYAHAASEPASPCHTIRSVADQVPAKYGSPIAFFGTYPTLAIRVSCAVNGTTRHVEVGDGSDATYIYKYGYHKVGGVRKRIEFSGTKSSGSWLLGSAQKVLPESDEKEGSVYAYMCRLVQGSWKCGCRDATCATPMWQIQRYSSPATDASDASSILNPTEDAPIEDSLLEAIKEMHNGISETKMATLEKEIKESQIAYSKEVFNVYGAQVTHVHPGDSVTLSGYDLAPKVGQSVQVLWGTAAKVPATVAADGRSVHVVVPALLPGKYALRVEREGEKTPNQVMVWIKDDVLQAPTIIRILPGVGKQGDTFTVFGSGFAREHNDIMTTFGLIEDVPSRDGTTMTFVYKPFEDFLKNTSKESDFSVLVRVINAGGFNLDSTATFQLKI